ncbi:hypothetical protein LCGC14_1107740 [marine sediment metagenome]|uniref:Uncharacterized protein n=1 Tax=marine sediment metagenome TaxID=412755 RepID=A0A0F9QDW5_9ZZZZ
MIMAQFELTEEHKEAGLSLGEDDDFLALKLNGDIVTIFRWQHVTQTGVTWAANKYLENCPEVKRYKAYDWCKLSNNGCIRNTGNQIFDRPCDYYTDFLKEVYEIKAFTLTPNRNE